MTRKIKNKIVLFFNAYWLKELVMLFKYHKFICNEKEQSMFISTIDERRKTQGLADRFKGIVSVYALSKANNIPFKCLYTYPFRLDNYLIPNKYNWLPCDSELSMSVFNVKYKILRKQPSIRRLIELIPTRKQVRVYANLDYLDEINRLYNTNFIWSELFNELFKLTPELESEINYHLKAISSKDFIACAFRFQALLGDFKEYDQQPKSIIEQEKIIKKNKTALISLFNQLKKPILVTSDSERFINEVKDLDFVFTLPGEIIHIDCANDAEKEAFMKVFVDFFMISHASQVYSIGTEEMYPSEFPMYAAKVRDVPFKRILV